jgi:hypothetical protein
VPRIDNAWTAKQTGGNTTRGTWEYSTHDIVSGFGLPLWTQLGGLGGLFLLGVAIRCLGLGRGSSLFAVQHAPDRRRVGFRRLLLRLRHGARNKWLRRTLAQEEEEVAATDIERAEGEGKRVRRHGMTRDAAEVKYV